MIANTLTVTGAVGPDEAVDTTPPWYLLASSFVPIGLTVIAFALNNDLAALPSLAQIGRTMIFSFFLLSLVSSAACALIACNNVTPLARRGLMIAMVCLAAYVACMPTIGALYRIVG